MNSKGQEVAIQAYTLNKKKAKKHFYEKIGNHRRFLLIKEVY